LNDAWSAWQGAVCLLEDSCYADPPGVATHWNTWYDSVEK